MKYEIKHIDDVLPHIKDNKSFVVINKDGYTVIDYIVQESDTFDAHPVLRECRGLIFGLDGKLISRAYHKFFNLNEKEETKLTPGLFEGEHVILEKLDGSMVRPVNFTDDVKNFRMMTRKGITDVAMQSEVFVSANVNYLHFMEDMILQGYTPIFEWCSRQNRIVLEYEDEKLILTGVRHTNSGEYLSYAEIKELANNYNLECVKYYEVSDVEDFLNQLKDREDTEGVVVCFKEDGKRIKIKTSWYSGLHRIRSYFERERYIVELILDNKIDDIIAALPDQDQIKLINYSKDFWKTFEEMEEYYSKVSSHLISESNNDRKTFALGAGLEVDSFLKALVFAVWGDKTSVRDYLISILRKNLSKECSFVEIKPFILGTKLKW